MRGNDEKIADVFLLPGESCFVGSTTRVRTLLGSCVALTMWHPLLRIGGMCHFVLPTRIDSCDGSLDGRYGDEALRILLAHAAKWSAAPRQFHVKLFGGSSVVAGDARNAGRSVGAKNLVCARRLCAEFGLRIAGEHTGGTGHRSVRMDMRDGLVWVRYSDPSTVERGHSRSRRVG
ncbi:MAG: chemotaxis protein CheD [Gammaproteobacteria bacterium]